VFSSYQQLALDVRATAESNTPVKVQFGYDRSIAAYVPKRNTNADRSAAAMNDSTADRGEAVSIISNDDIASTVTPPLKTDKTYEVLRADSAFVTGVAANVATAPDNATVVIVPGKHAVAVRDAESSLVAKTAAAHEGFAVKTEGNPGERLSAALVGFLAPTQLEVANGIDFGVALSGKKRQAYFDAVAARLPIGFQDTYETLKRDSHLPADEAFRAASRSFLAPERKGVGPRHTMMVEALRGAQEAGQHATTGKEGGQ
jgi:hypothetical protein